MERPGLKLELINNMSRLQKNLVQVGADTALMMFSYVLAIALRLERLGPLSSGEAWLPLLCALPLMLLCFYLSGAYRNVIRYVTGRLLITLGMCSLAAAVVLYFVNIALGAPVPRSVPGIFLIVLMGSTSGARFLARTLVRFDHRKNRKRVLIYGAGEAGQQILNALAHGNEYAPVGLVDDAKDLQNMRVRGFRVNPPSHLKRMIDETGARQLLLAMPSVSRSRLAEIIEGVEHLGVKVKTVPGMSAIVDGNAKISDFRTVTPEDLLGRDPVPPFEALMAKNVSGKVVFVSGAGGSIGSELCRQIVALEPRALIAFEQSEFSLYALEIEIAEKLDVLQNDVEFIPILGSVQNAKRVRETLHAYSVETIYHAAAYKHVPLLEENIVEGIRNNVFGTKCVAEEARRAGVKNFLLVSTDKAVRPTNVMGATKRIGELICQALAQETQTTVYSMVRFGNVLGSSGSVIPRFRSQIENGLPLTVTHQDINRFFMSIPEAAQLVIQAGAMAVGGDVFVLDMGKPVKIIDMAQSMVRLHGLQPYVVGSPEEISFDKGDVPIVITGLRKGEKLYEELLIGNDPQESDHPRIMRASEICLSQPQISSLLSQLDSACERGDVELIRELLLKAPLGYAPTADNISDRIWSMRTENARHRPVAGQANATQYQWKV